MNWQNTLLDRNPQWHILVGDKAVYQLYVGVNMLEMITVLWTDEDVVQMLGPRSWQTIDQIL